MLPIAALAVIWNLLDERGRQLLNQCQVEAIAKLKHWLRKAAKRSIEAVYTAIGPILNTVTSAECANYFANAGYDQAETHPALEHDVFIRKPHEQ
jgi:hypothetical protein